MKLTFSQSIILACVASSALAAAVPLETREPRGISSRKHTGIVGLTSDTAAAQISSSLAGRDIGDDSLVEREPARGRRPSPSARNAAHGIGSFAGALAAQQLNQENQENSVAARGLDIDESIFETREFEEDLLVERSPRGGFGRSRSRSSSLGQGRRRRRHRHNNHTGPHCHADSGAGAVADASTSNSDGASNMETRDFEDNLLVERSPKKHKAKKAKGSNNKKPAHLKAAHEDDVDAVASEVTAGLQGRDFEDDLLFERDPRGGRGFGRGFGRHAGEAAHAAGSEIIANLETRDFEDDLLVERDPRGGRGRSIGRHAGSFLGEAAGAAGSEAAANLETRDFEDDLLFQRSPKGGRGGGGRSGGGRSGGGRSGGRSGGSLSGGRLRFRPQLFRKPVLPHHDIVGEVTEQVASNIQNRELGEDALVQREPFHPFRRARKHSNNIANTAGAAGSEVAPSSQESS